MSFTIIREERITHTGNGLQLEDDLYIKLDATFDELVAELGRGGQLPALIHIQLREAYASTGRGAPATLKTIAHAAGDCTIRQAQRIVKSLLGKSLIAEAGLSPSTGEKFYRPLGYAWFGNRRPTGMTSMSPQDSGKEKGRPMSPLARPNVIADAECHPPDTVVVVDIQTNKQELEQTTTQTREILKKCGILGKPLDRLSENVAPENARLWREWLEEPHPYLRNPIGVVVNALLADPDARPTLKAKKEETARRPSITGKLASGFRPSDEDPAHEN